MKSSTGLPHIASFGQALHCPLKVFWRALNADGGPPSDTCTCTQITAAEQALQPDELVCFEHLSPNSHTKQTQHRADFCGPPSDTCTCTQITAAEQALQPDELVCFEHLSPNSHTKQTQHRADFCALLHIALPKLCTIHGQSLACCWLPGQCKTSSCGPTESGTAAHVPHPRQGWASWLQQASLQAALHIGCRFEHCGATSFLGLAAPQ